LDRGLVLGRAPRVPEDFVGERPHVVKVVDPRSEVSSQHVLLSLDYWNVLVTDLGSTNGTELVLPDGRRQRLVAHSPVVIEAGTRIVLAEILELTFEATA
jgi:pSer/pThr/pTyr-binding forkhead associated (FHA) protein